MAGYDEEDRALLVAMPLRHLEAALAAGSDVLPAGGPGDLDAIAIGSRVLLIATEAGDAGVPAATWRATFAGRVPFEPGQAWPDGLPPTWIEEHPPPSVPAAADDEPRDAGAEAEDDDEEDEDEESVGPQSFFRIEQLARSPREEWIFANELVPKQQRGGRSFLPRAPTAIRLVD